MYKKYTYLLFIVVNLPILLHSNRTIAFENLNRVKNKIINNNHKSNINYIATADLQDKKLNSKNHLKHNTKSKFQDLPLIKDFSKKSKFGKIDPFEFNLAVPTEKNITLISLLGVYSTANKKYAIVEYRGKIGDIFEGNIGGINTNFLPNNYEITKINMDTFSIIIRFNNEIYEIKG